MVKNMAIACKTYAVVYGILWMNNMKRNNPYLGMGFLRVEPSMGEKDIVFSLWYNPIESHKYVYGYILGCFYSIKFPYAFFQRSLILVIPLHTPFYILPILFIPTCFLIFISTFTQPTFYPFFLKSPHHGLLLVSYILLIWQVCLTKLGNEEKQNQCSQLLTTG